MQKSNEQLPIIDWEQAKQFINDGDELNHELLILFAEQAPQTQTNINQAFKQSNRKILDEHLHKLQGACVYCGLSRLKHAVIELNKALKNAEQFPAPLLLENLNQEMAAVIEELKTKKIIK